MMMLMPDEENIHALFCANEPSVRTAPNKAKKDCSFFFNY